MVNRKSLSAEFLQKLSAETLSVSAEIKSSVSAFLQKELFLQKDCLSAEIASICRKFLEFGQSKGEIFTKDTLIIGPGATVDAQIEAENVVISGHVKGNIFARKKVVMHPPAKFQGTVTTPSLRIDEGVLFEGASYMSKK